MACGGCGRAPDGKALRTESTGEPRNVGGEIVYPGPAPEIKGYRHDPNDSRRLLPLWPRCVSRRTRILLRQDGAYQIANVCGNAQHEEYRLDVSPDDCTGCSFRRES